MFGEADFFALPSAAEALPARSAAGDVVRLAGGGFAASAGSLTSCVRASRGCSSTRRTSPALTAALRTMHDDAVARRAMGEHARERIVSAYSLKICVDKLLEVYGG